MDDDVEKAADDGASDAEDDVKKCGRNERQVNKDREKGSGHANGIVA